MEKHIYLICKTTWTIRSYIYPFGRHPLQRWIVHYLRYDTAIAEVCAWLVSHKLKFNDTKTEFITIGTHQDM